MSYIESFAKSPARILTSMGGRILATLAVAALAGAAFCQQSHVPNRVLVKFREGTPELRGRVLAASFGANEVSEIGKTGVKVMALPPNANERAYMQAFRGEADVEFAELDEIVPLAQVSANDPYYSSAWHLQKIGCPTAWATNVGSSSVIIAIVDSGCAPTQPDLMAKYVQGWNFYDGNSDFTDVYGHGTGVAGTAAASSNNATGVTAIAWNSKIMPLRVSDTSGMAAISTMANAVTYAADRGARVVNLSFKVSTSSTIASAGSYLQARGGVLVVGAGNNAAQHTNPNSPYMVVVSSTNSSDLPSTFSDYGSDIDLAAPGETIKTTMRNGGYGSGSGTSFSAPVVAGVAALVISVNPSLTGAQVQQVLFDSADDLGPAGWDSKYGYGRVNAAKAVALAASGSSNTDTTPPVVNFTSPASGATLSGSTTVQVSATDNVGVRSVTLSINGTQVGEDTSSPFTFSVNTSNYANGGYTFTARALDAAGNAASKSISVTISNSTPDTTPPTLSFSSPASGATLSGAVSVQISASDNVGVQSVSLSLNGTLLGTDSSAPYAFSLNTANYANGSYTLMAVAKDAAGNSASKSIGVTISNSAVGPDTQAPVVSITSPTGGAVPSSLTVHASASDNVGVVKVELYVNGKLQSTSSSSPYSFTVNTKPLKKGIHTLQCKAYDAAGNNAWSQIVSLTK